MDIDVQKTSQFPELAWKSYEICICGEALDDRGTAALDEITKRTNKLLRLKYDAKTFTLILDDILINVDDLSEGIKPLLTGRVLIEATTLGFVEVLLCCRALRRLGVESFDILYVEPKLYRSPQRSHLLHRRDFELTNEVSGYKAVPGHALLLGERKPHKGIFFVGYEESRLRRAFEDLPMIKPSTSAITFGVPAYHAGWEMDSIANNITVIREQNIRGGMYFCPAENPVLVIELLSEIRQSVMATHRMFIAPIGTKPHGIGVALFVSMHQDVRIIYDHPQRTHGRSGDIAHCHLFSVKNAWSYL